MASLALADCRSLPTYLGKSMARGGVSGLCGRLGYAAREESAVDGEDVAGDVRGIIAGKKQDRARDLGGRAVASERGEPRPSRPVRR